MNKSTIPQLKLSYTPSDINADRLESLESVIDALRKAFDPDTFYIQEEIVLLFFDSAYKPLGYHTLSKGTKETVPCDIRRVAQIALLSEADAVVFAHNHPNGIKYPSEDDTDLCFALSHLLHYHEIELRDFIVLTDKEYYSFRENNMMSFYHAE